MLVAANDPEFGKKSTKNKAYNAITIKKTLAPKKFTNAYVLSFNYDATTVELIKSLSNRTYVPDTHEWEIPESELVNIGKMFSNRLFFDDPVLEKKVVALIAEDLSSCLSAKDRLYGIKPESDFVFKTKPLPHQIEAFNYGLKRHQLLLCDEQGLGKTKESIDITVSKKDELNKVLVVCGVNSVRFNWAQEISIHSDEKSIILGNEHDVLSDLERWLNDDTTYFGIINIEKLRKTEIISKISEYIKSQKIGGVIVDEVHKIKNPKTQQGKAVANNLRDAKFKIGLTGTPITNNPLDLWNILNWLGATRDNYFAFRNKYVILGGWEGKQVMGFKNLNNLNADLQQIMLRRTKNDVINLPPKIYKNEYIELSALEKKEYKEQQNHISMIIKKIEDENGDIQEKAVPNILGLLIRLRESTSGINSSVKSKIERLVELYTEEYLPLKRKIIVFTNFTETVKDVVDALAEYNPLFVTGNVPLEERQQKVNLFQSSSEHNIIVGTIGAMGTGLTLNKASAVIFIDKSYSYADNLQAEDRAHRIGTEHSVNVISLIAKNTIDENIESILANKKEYFDKTVNTSNSNNGLSKKELKKILNNLIKQKSLYNMFNSDLRKGMNKIIQKNKNHNSNKLLTK